jgi:dihydrolipoamide dehydrogenase
MKKKWDLAVIGGGPGGYVAALRAAQLKQDVILVEAERIGGTCMNWGCIPVKYLLHQTNIYREIIENKNLDVSNQSIGLDWGKVQAEKERIVERLVRGIEHLLKQNEVEIVKGKGFLKSEHEISIMSDDSERMIEAHKIILASGSHPASLPFLEPDGEKILTSRQALELQTVPKSILVVGAGAVGLELGSIFQRLGSDVSIIEIMPTLLPGCERELMDRMKRILKRQGLKIYTQMKIEDCFKSGNAVGLSGTNQRNQESFQFEGDIVIAATGRSPNSIEFQTFFSGRSFDRQGFLKVNSLLETETRGIFAIGDLIGGKLLAHKASHEGIAAAENCAGSKTEIDYRALPMAVFTDPEFASVGMTQQEAEDAGIKIQVGTFSLQASGRALSLGKPDGIVKVIGDESDTIIGAHLLAPNASEVIPEMTLAIQKRLKLTDIEKSIHIHPTVSEAGMEAAMKAKNRAIHILN